MTATDTTRAGIVETAMTYLDALVSHDSASVRLADDVRRIGNGKDIVAGADALRAVIEREPVGAIDALRWVVDGDTRGVGVRPRRRSHEDGAERDLRSARHVDHQLHRRALHRRRRADHRDRGGVRGKRSRTRTTAATRALSPRDRVATRRRGKR